MKSIFLKSSIGRTFLVLPDFPENEPSSTPYIIFFDKENMLRYFELKEYYLEKHKAFYALPRPIGIEKLTGSWNYFFVVLLDSEEIKEFFVTKIFPKMNITEFPDYLVLIEESPNSESLVIEANKRFCTLFYIEVADKLIPISYAPFNYTRQEFSSYNNHKTILSLGNARNFTMSYLKNGELTISPNFGELSNLYEIDAMEFLVASIVGKEKKDLFVLQEEDSYSIVNDFSTRISRLQNIKHLNHINSHFANLLYDNNITKSEMICIVYDNISYNSRDEIVGSEFVYGNLKNMKVAGKWKPLPLPGGDIANVEPWRIALAAIKEVINDELDTLDLSIVKNIKDNPHYSYIFNAINKKVISYSLTSSMHHIIAAIGEILFFEENVKNFDFFELMLDDTIKNNIMENYEVKIYKDDGIYLIDTYELIKKIILDIFEGKDKREIFSKALQSILSNTLELVKIISKETSIKSVGLTGEVFKHPNILKSTLEILQKNKFEVYLPQKIPLDDSSLSVGQILSFLFSDES
ncbi:MAG: hypothetical protein ACP5QT_02335 [Brevinematia bacterium]